MIGDNLGQIAWFRPLGNDRGGVGNVLKQRTVRKERASCHENDPRVRLPIAGEIRRCDRAAFFQHHIKNKHVWCIVTKEFDRIRLACDHGNGVPLSFQVLCPDTRKMRV